MPRFNPFADPSGVWTLTEEQVGRLRAGEIVPVLHLSPDKSPGEIVKVRVSGAEEVLEAVVFTVSPHPMREGEKRFMWYDVVLGRRD